jgi:lipopolysaccharide transport system permease protein
MSQNKVTTFIGMLASIFNNRKLIFELSKRDIENRFKGSIIGLAWAFINPLLMLVVYTVFFSIIFKTRWNIKATESQGDIAVILFAGLIIYSFFIECINKAPLLIAGNVNFVKKIIFPLEILPCIAVGSALFQAFVSLVMLLIVQLLLTGDFPWTVIFFPLIVLPLIFTTLGFTWFLAAFGVYNRDISQFMGFITSVLMFISPIFYPVSILPTKMQTIMLLNPLAIIIEQTRKVLVFNQIPDWGSLIVLTICSALIAWLGYWVFQKTRKGFADVL